jgi:ubiquinone/menaquinone biosynthesis C-methylase UbiE
MINLSVGCGLGSIKERYETKRDIGHSFLGKVNIDIRYPRIRINNFLLASAEYLPFKNNIFSFAFSGHVLEHLTNPLLAIRESNRVSKGVLHIYPNFFGCLSSHDHKQITLKNRFYDMPFILRIARFFIAICYNHNKYFRWFYRKLHKNIKKRGDRN